MLKGIRCETAKCPIEKKQRNVKPGMLGWTRGRLSDYGVRLREKQKCKRYYGVLEKQFRRYFDEAQRIAGNTGENLLAMLERRLDNVLTICGYAASRAQGRQLVRHGHIQVNGRTVDVANYLVVEGDVVRPKPVDAMLDRIRAAREATGHLSPGWLEVNDADLTIRVVRMPVREDVTVDVQEGLVVEFCSR
jgi:small subunit ribosomal protein S4